MIKLIVKLALAALIANAVWRVGSAQLSFYRFKDSTAEAAKYNLKKSDDELRQKVLDLASNYDVPLSESDFTLRRDGNHIFINGSYTQPLDLLPGYQYRWPFTFEIDAAAVEPGPLK